MELGDGRSAANGLPDSAQEAADTAAIPSSFPTCLQPESLVSSSRLSLSRLLAEGAGTLASAFFARRQATLLGPLLGPSPPSSLS